jgi:hypothetical protein
MPGRRKTFHVAVLAAAFAVVPSLYAIPVLDPGGPGGLTLFNVSNLTAFNTDHPTGLFEGLAITSTTLYLSLGDPTSLAQTVWALPLVRTNGHIVSVESSGATLYKSVPGNGSLGEILSGGLVTVNGGILYTLLPSSVGQAVGAPVASSIGSSGNIGGLQYIPPSQNNAGNLKVSSSDGTWYTVAVSGTPGAYTLGPVLQDSLASPVSAYAFDYMPADGTFAAGMILGDAASISYYGLNGNGAPLASSGITLVDAVDTGIGYGLARDPFSGDVLFTTGDNQIFRLSDTLGETPEPSTVLLALGGIALLAARARPSF